jgi:hypothetical protein
MAWTYTDIIKSRYADVEAEQASINSEIERARIYEDNDALAAALERHDSNQVRLQSINNAVSAMQRVQQPQTSGYGDGFKRGQPEIGNRYGFSPDELSIAMNITSDPHVTDEQKAQMYYEGRKRHRDWRAAGNLDESDLQGKNYPGRY